MKGVKMDRQKKEKIAEVEIGKTRTRNFLMF